MPAMQQHLHSGLNGSVSFTAIQDIVQYIDGDGGRQRPAESRLQAFEHRRAWQAQNPPVPRLPTSGKQMLLRDSARTEAVTVE